MATTAREQQIPGPKVSAVETKTLDKS